jgi:hypothetical protein
MSYSLFKGVTSCPLLLSRLIFTADKPCCLYLFSPFMTVITNSIWLLPHLTCRSQRSSPSRHSTQCLTRHLPSSGAVPPCHHATTKPPPSVSKHADDVPSSLLCYSMSFTLAHVCKNTLRAPPTTAPPYHHRNVCQHWWSSPSTIVVPFWSPATESTLSMCARCHHDPLLKDVVTVEPPIVPKPCVVHAPVETSEPVRALATLALHPWFDPVAVGPSSRAAQP